MNFLAKTLGRKLPTLEIIARSCSIDKKRTDVIRNIVVHLFQNSMDQEIQSPKECERKNKCSKGKISIELTYNEGLLCIDYRDDERGLDLEKIKDKAAQNGFLAKNDQELPDKATKFIFESGFSIVGNIAQISGRGVGMSAVSRCVEEIGEYIKLHLGVGQRKRISQKGV